MQIKMRSRPGDRATWQVLLPCTRTRDTLEFRTAPLFVDVTERSWFTKPLLPTYEVVTQFEQGSRALRKRGTRQSPGSGAKGGSPSRCSLPYVRTRTIPKFLSHGSRSYPRLLRATWSNPVFRSSQSARNLITSGWNLPASLSAAVILQWNLDADRTSWSAFFKCRFFLGEASPTSFPFELERESEVHDYYYW